MFAHPPHDRKLGLSGIALTQQKNNRHDTKALTAVRDALGKALVEAKYFDAVPFSWVTIAIRYGLKNDDIPVYQGINKKYGDLPLAIEIDTHELIGASFDDLRLIFEVAALRALIHAGRKFNRPTSLLDERLKASYASRNT